ncbi:MAG TPA: DUF4384 domain-containing protein, partial [Gemmataceae bacterium]|nr:DUF4384 domain-containing protein [Gemmataceae bacterium]
VGDMAALDWEHKNHPAAGADSWFGYCHAGSAAAVVHPQPNRVRRIRGGLTLSVGDQKGLLCAIHAADSADSFGRRSETDDPTRPEYIDLTPDQLWRYLKLYVQQKGVPLIMDLEAGKQVWNYPIYHYRVQYSSTGGEDYRGRITIWYAEDNVTKDFVGTKPGSRTYHCTFKMRGGSVVSGSGHWVGPSVKNHPDFAWYPKVTKPENPNVSVAKVLEMLGQGSFSRNLDLPDVALAEPMSDPGRPPQPIGMDASPEAPKAEEPTLNLEPGTVTLTPADLIALVANKRSKFHLLVQTADFNGMYKKGDPYKVAVLSEKPGYLYLLHLDKDGNVKVLFPMDGQDNRIPPGGKKIEFPGPKDTFRFVCEAVGDNRVKGVVTSKPLNFTGLDRSGDDESDKKGGQGLGFFFNPQQEDEMRSLLNKEVLQNDDKREQAVRDVKADLEGLGDFAQGEVTFYVDRAAKDK